MRQARATFTAMTTASVSNGISLSGAPIPGNGSLMEASFAPFRPKVRVFWDATNFYAESDNMPSVAIMPNLMVTITSWQQQVPIPASYFAHTTNPENNSGSLGYRQPNVWRIPLVPVPSGSPLPISSNTFTRGAVAVAVNGIAIFNPRNNTGKFSYSIGELDAYGGHCGMADDYHYHIAPVHLQSIVGTNLPVAWALDGYPIYGYDEPDGSPQQPLDGDGGHTNVAGFYHYHALGNAVSGPQQPFLFTNFHGTVVYFGNQVDGQPEIGSLRAPGTGGYTNKAVAGASITAYMNPVALTNDAAGHLSHAPAGVPSADDFLMRVTIAGTNYDECWRINRKTNPKTLTMTWRLPTIPTTTTNYNSVNNRLTSYVMSGPSFTNLPDTGQTNIVGASTGQDAEFVVNPPAFTDLGSNTILDNVTGLFWQKIDSGEMTWDRAFTNGASVTDGGFTDWRLPTPHELFSICNLGRNPAVDPTYFPTNPAGAAQYWWTSDLFGSDTSRIWSVNAGGGLGPKQKSETLSAGGAFRYHARYVRGAPPSNGHNFRNNNDGTISDLDTGLMWLQVPASATNWYAALSNAESFVFAGSSDWRLPNVKEMQSIVDVNLATSTAPASAVSILNRFLFLTNTTPATAYWTSTPLRNNSTNSAWLVEFGVNNSVAASNGPARGAQGIVSYETFTSVYPYFLVRGPDPTFIVTATQRSDTAITIPWASSPGRTYTVFYSPSLSPPAWTNIATVKCNGTLGTFSDTNTVRLAQPMGVYGVSYAP